MSRQDKATTDRNARILRELVKQPDNKACADCRRNDARWASWNLGVFVCIRCSGIHRSMGTHISKVKSVDLDIWTPEQMESMQIWGNRLGNMYWEKHLKPGHVPPEHKMESFIRSKYESKRWAMSGPRPDNPKDLEDGSAESAQAVAPPPAQTQPRAAPPQQQPQARAAPAASRQQQQQQPVAHPLLSRSSAAAVPARQAPAAVSLFDSPNSPSPPATSAAAPPPAAAAPASSSSIFDLDFHSPAPAAAPAKAASAKNDIMSLFGAPPPPAPAPQPWGGSYAGGASAAGGGGGSTGGMSGLTNGMGSMGFGGSGSSGADVWGSSASVQQQQQQAPRPQQQQQPIQTNLWDSTPSQNVWSTPSSPPATTAPKQLDAFADIWK